MFRTEARPRISTCWSCPRSHRLWPAASSDGSPCKELLLTVPNDEGATMTELLVRLPDDLARRARSAGLLSDSAIQELREDAMRPQAGRRLRDLAERIHAPGIPSMSMEEIDAEIKAVCAAQAAKTNRGGA